MQLPPDDPTTTTTTPTSNGAAVNPTPNGPPPPALNTQTATQSTVTGAPSLPSSRPSAPASPIEKTCHACKKKIGDRYLLKALDLYWHEDCLKCSCCDCRLGEVGSTLFSKANMLLCKRDYLR